MPADVRLARPVPVLCREYATGASVTLSSDTACLRGDSRDDGAFRATAAATVGELWPGERAIVFGTAAGGPRGVDARGVVLDVVVASRGSA